MRGRDAVRLSCSCSVGGLCSSTVCFGPCVCAQAKRDERFYLKPDQVYDLLEPKRVTRHMMSTTL